MGRGTSIDIVICTYNNAALLDRTLAAMSKQQVSPDVRWEVLVVNNNCTDETPEIVEKHLQSGEISLRMITESKQGLTPARVCGVKDTGGEWIAFVDDDCLLAEDWIEQAVRFAAAHPECGAFGGQIIPEWEVAPPPHVLNHLYAYACKYHGETVKRRSWLAGAGMVVRRAALENCGWIDQQFLEDRTGARLVSGGDMEIALRVGAKYELWYNPNCKLRHVIPERRMSRQYLRRITFGLGASRHNAAALTWRGSYLSWFLYSVVYLVGFGAFGILQIARRIFGSQSGADFAISFSPVRGWWSAMWGMLWMNQTERQQLLGCAVARGRNV
ncbi:MAG: glycosyltransferase family 2 protein [Acidobacteriota bacterium]|nr:glycosyltransferase family 2 protein [Acidobacteriota bacterium]